MHIKATIVAYAFTVKYFKDATIRAYAGLMVKVYPFQFISHPSTSSSLVRRFWTISYANASVSRLILAELTWICHLIS